MSDNGKQLYFNFDPVPSPPLMSAGEIYDKADQSLLQQLAEDRRIERKPAGIHARALGDYFSMWANTPPEGGLIVIGLENDGLVSGCLRHSQQHMNELKKVGDTFCPDARYSYKQVKLRRSDGEEDYVLLFHVHYRRVGKIVRNNKSEAFIRLGDSKIQLNEDQIRELEIDKGYVDFEQEPTNYSFPQEFDLDLSQQFSNGYRKHREG